MDLGAHRTRARANAILTVFVNPPVIPASEPANKSVGVGSTATFSVTVAGTAPFAYQWTQGGTAIAGATSASYTTPASTLAISQPWTRPASRRASPTMSRRIPQG